MRWSFTYGYPERTVSTLDEAIALAGTFNGTFNAVYTGEGPFTATPEEQAVIDVISPHWVSGEKPEYAYATALEGCANAHQPPLVRLFAIAANMICPGAPQLADQVAEATGTAFGDGSRVIGELSPAGTYSTIPGIENCYWERSRGDGSTIDNDFVTFAPDGISLALAAGEGFTSQGCGTWTLIP